MMQILERQGHLRVSRAQPASVYRATSSRERVLRKMVHEFVDRVSGGSAEPLVQHLLRDTRLTDVDLRAVVARLLQEHGGDDG